MFEVAAKWLEMPEDRRVARLHVLGTALSGNAADAGSLADSPPGNPAVADELLVKLRELLEDDDSDALEVVESLLPRVSGESAQVLKEIAVLVEDYEFEIPLRQLESMF